MRARSTLAIVLITALAFSVVTAPSAAAADTTVPTLTKITVSPVSINTGIADVTVTVRITASDPGSGIAEGCAFFETPSTFPPPDLFAPACFDASNLISGDVFAGVYESSFVVPRYSHRGFYPIAFVGLLDSAENVAVYFGDDLPAGSHSGFTVTGTHDVTPPVVQEASLTPSVIDVGPGPASVEFRAHVTDALSGFAFGCVDFSAPSAPGAAYASMCVLDPDDRESGTRNDGEYAFTYEFTSEEEPGIYHVLGGWFYDGSRNERFLNPTQLKNAGFPTSFTIENSAATVPDAPSITNVSYAANNNATVFFSPPANNGGAPVTSYTVTASPGNKTATSTGTSAVITGLQPVTSYTFTVRATNIVGDSTESAPFTKVSNPVAPSTPGAPTVTAGNGSFTISWSPPPDGGSPITGYRVQNNTLGIVTDAPGTGTSTTISGLVGGTSYAFSVSAQNAAGSSQFSGATSRLLEVGLPAPVTNATSKGSDQKATVSWNAPSNTGGTPLTGYTVSVAPSVGAPFTVPVAPTQTSLALSDLTNGMRYSFQVVATNAIGNSTTVNAGSVVPNPPLPAPGSATATATAGVNSVLLQWPAVTGASSYTVTHVQSGVSATTTVRAFTFTGLTEHAIASFLVRGNDANGPGFDVTSNSVIVGEGPPPPPGTVVAVAGTNGTADVSWTASTGTLVSSYIVTVSPGNTSKTVPAPQLDTTFTGLTNGTSYFFTVRAVNMNGTGGYSDWSNEVTPVATANVPGAPGSVNAVRGDQQATVSWSAPTANGSPITGYKVITWPGPTVTSVPASETSLVVTGLTNGVPHLFNVIATNAVGDSPMSITSPLVTPAGFPVAPATVTAVGGNANATVSWNAATPNGEPISGYTITASPGGATKSVAGDQTSASVTGLTNGTPYTFTVRATNAVGHSADSSPSNVVTPQTVVIETGLPIVAMLAPGAVALSRTIPVKWIGADISGIDHFEVRRRTTVWNGSPGAWSSWKSSTTATNANDSGTYGRTYCYGVRAEDGVGNMSNWSQKRCTVVPLSSDQLGYTGSWKRVPNAGAFAGVSRVTKTKGAKMTRPGIVAKSLSLVTTRCPTCGRVEVRWNGKLLKQWNLAATRTTRKYVMTIANFPTPQKGTLTVTNVSPSGKQVNIEGVAVYNG